MVDFLQLEQDGVGVPRGDRLGDLLSDAVSLLEGTPLEADKDAICIAVNDIGKVAPVRVALDESDGVLKGLSARLDNRVCELGHGHPAGKPGGGVAIRDVGNQFECKLFGVKRSREGLGVGRGIAHGALDHDPRLEDLVEQSGQHAAAMGWRYESDPVGCNDQAAGVGRVDVALGERRIQAKRLPAAQPRWTGLGFFPPASISFFPVVFFPPVEVPGSTDAG